MDFVRRSKRKTITIDRGVADTIKEISMRHGATINSYLKSLIEAVKEIEDTGLYAPAAIRDLMSIVSLSRLGMVMIPADLLNHLNSDRETIIGSATRIGRALKEVKTDVGRVIEFLGVHYRVLIPVENRIIVVGSGKTGTILADIIRGIASGGGLEVTEEEGIVTIKIENRSRTKTE